MVAVVLSVVALVVSGRRLVTGADPAVVVVAPADVVVVGAEVVAVAGFAATTPERDGRPAAATTLTFGAFSTLGGAEGDASGNS